MESNIEKEKILVSYKGSYFYTYYNPKEEYFYCPICGTRDDSPIFFSKDDLIFHMKTHIIHKKR